MKESINMQQFTEKELVTVLQEAGHPLRLDDILRRSGMTRRSKKEVLGLLLKLSEEGRIMRLRGGAYAVGEILRNIRGKIAVQRSGAAFVTPDPNPMGEDVFIPPFAVGDAWNGDLVEVSLAPRSRSFQNRPSRGGKREGKVVRVLERGQKEISIRVLRQLDADRLLTRPTDPRLNFDVIIDLRNGQNKTFWQQAGGNAEDCCALLLAEMGEKLPSRSDTGRWAGQFTRFLGEEDKVSVQEQITKLSHGIPITFPDDVVQEAEKLAERNGFAFAENRNPVLEQSAETPLKPWKKVQKNFFARGHMKTEAGDVDLRSVALVTIDGEDARDFDDAVFVEKRGENWRLLVAIADVSRYVAPDSKLDREAKARANSYYFPSSVEPMLPEALSNGLCSLRPEEDHRVMFADMLFDRHGKRRSASFGQGIMCSSARLTYNQVQDFFSRKELSPTKSTEDIIKGGADSSAEKAEFPSIFSIVQEKPQLADMLTEAQTLAEILIERRRKKGGLNLDIPEPRCEIVDGRVKAMHPRERLFSHELIEAFMVAANEAVAEFLRDKHVPCLFRVHPAPSPDRMESLAEALTRMGTLSLPTLSPRKMGESAWIAAVLAASTQFQQNTHNEMAQQSFPSKFSEKKNSDAGYSASKLSDSGISNTELSDAELSDAGRSDFEHSKVGHSSGNISEFADKNSFLSSSEREFGESQEEFRDFDPDFDSDFLDNEEDHAEKRQNREKADPENTYPENLEDYPEEFNEDYEDDDEEDFKEIAAQKGDSEEAVSPVWLVHRLILRSMMQARYTPEQDEHFGLASECYCHFTSPIRRYADLMIHRALKYALKLSDIRPPSEEKLLAIADGCNDREREAQAAEREIYRRMGCLLLENAEGQEFAGIISGVSSFGLFVEMSSMVEGMIPIDRVGSEYFIYDETEQALFSVGGKTAHRLGDSVRVRIAEVNLSRLEITLEWVDSQSGSLRNASFRKGQKNFARSSGKALPASGKRSSYSSEKNPGHSSEKDKNGRKSEQNSGHKSGRNKNSGQESGKKGQKRRSGTPDYFGQSQSHKTGKRGK